MNDLEKRKKNTKKQTVNIGYPSEHAFAPDAKFESIAKQFSDERDGSGCGFGQRDMHFNFPDKKSAQGFIKECKKTDWGFEIIAELSKY